MKERKQSVDATDRPDADCSVPETFAPRYWSAVAVRHVDVRPAEAAVPDLVRLEAVVHLGRLAPADVVVEADIQTKPPCDADVSEHSSIVRLSGERCYDGSVVFEGLIPHTRVTDLDTIEVRVLPACGDVTLPPHPVARRFHLR